MPHSIDLDGRGLVYVADRVNSRVQVFDRQGHFKAQWISRVAANAPASQPESLANWRSQVSSVAYNAHLDAFVVVEGADVVVRR